MPTITDTVLLRTLTSKSILHMGRYENQKVDTVIEIDNFYLATLYFLNDKINFTEDVLVRLGIYGNLRINKPGKSKEKYHQFNIIRIAAMSDEEREEYFRQKYIERKQKAMAAIQRCKNHDRKAMSKGFLQRNNQGHNRGNFSTITFPK